MKLFKIKNTGLLPVLLAGSIALQLLTLLVNITTSSRLSTQIPILVELNDGTTARVVPLPYNKRSAVVINNFIRRTLTGLMSWRAVSSEQLTTEPQLDKGVATKKGRITTSTFEAGFAFSEDFRTGLLSEIAELTPEGIFNNAKTQSLLVIKHLSQPQKIAEGRWRVNMVSNLVIFQGGGGIGQATKFNKTIYVRSIDIPPLPRKATKLQQQMYKARRDGLEIYFMENFK